MRLKIIEVVQGVAIIGFIVSAICVLGGTEFQEELSDITLQFWTGIGCVMFFSVIMGCMELLKRFEKYLMTRRYNELDKLFDQISEREGKRAAK